MDPSCAAQQEMSNQTLETILVCTKQNNNNNNNMNLQDHQKKPRPQPDQALKCPRCESTNTKFCYYNNYSLSQPRYFCKSCRRYWTKGGTLRNVPVGGGCRKNKRSSSSSSSTSTSASSKTMIKPFHDDPLITTLPSLGYDAIDLNLAFSRLHQKQSLYGPGEGSIYGNSTNQHCDIFGNSTGFFGGQNGNFSTGFGYGFMMGSDDHHHRNNNISTNSMTMTFEMTGEVAGGGGGGGADMDAGRESWNGLSSSWHGLLNSPLM